MFSCNPWLQIWPQACLFYSVCCSFGFLTRSGSGRSPTHISNSASSWEIIGDSEAADETGQRPSPWAWYWPQSPHCETPFFPQSQVLPQLVTEKVVLAQEKYYEDIWTQHFQNHNVSVRKESMWKFLNKLFFFCFISITNTFISLFVNFSMAYVPLF